MAKIFSRKFIPALLAAVALLFSACSFFANDDDDDGGSGSSTATYTVTYYASITRDTLKTVSVASGNVLDTSLAIAPSDGNYYEFKAWISEDGTDYTGLGITGNITLFAYFERTVIQYTSEYTIWTTYGKSLIKDIIKVKKTNKADGTTTITTTVTKKDTSGNMLSTSTTTTDADGNVIESSSSDSIDEADRKDTTASILYGGESVSEKQTLSSAQEVLLSYSLVADDNTEIAATAEWEFEAGGDYVAGTDSNGSLKVSNLNCSGESQEVTVKLTLTPTNYIYRSTSASFSFIVADSTADLQPGSFTASAELSKTRGWGQVDGMVKVSWTKSQNAKSYYVYRNGKQIACIADKLYYLDDFSSDISDIASNNYNVTYYVKAENQGLSSETSSVDIFVGGLIPSSKASNVYAIPQKDSDGYYGVNITWEANDYYTFEVYRLVSYSTSESSAAIIKNGTRVMQWDSNYKSNNGKFEYSCYDYNIVDDVTSSSQYVHYTVVTKTTYSSSNNYIVFSSKPSATYSVKCTLLVGKPNKYAGSSTADSAYSSSSSKVTSISIRAKKCIVYNRYSYCELTLPKKSGVTYKIYRCARRSNQLGSPSASDCVYIGSESYTTYVDSGVCNQYFYENTSASGKYYYYMYYCVVGTDSSGNIYVSDIVKAE